MNAPHQGWKVGDFRPDSRIGADQGVDAPEVGVEPRRPLHGLVLALEAGQSNAPNPVTMLAQDGQRQMGAVADPPEIDRLRAKVTAQGVDVVGAFPGVVAPHGDTCLRPVGPGLDQLSLLVGNQSGAGQNR
jgi:hypothetical protein